MTCEYEKSHLCYMMKAHDTALRHGTRILRLQMQLLDRAEVMLRIRWSEQKLRENISFQWKRIGLYSIIPATFEFQASDT